MYGFEYALVSDFKTLKTKWDSFLETQDSPKVLEILTPTFDNDKQLKAFFENLT
jgi:2-succinyl-5-enolpyruvyl-6-hydroxy-3-cyclohexene-1-carboxylate synthase